MSRKWPSLALLSLCELLAISVWFAASAVVGPLSREFHLSPGQASWLTGSVSLGFVAGTLISALGGLADRIDGRRLFAASALLGALSNASLLQVPASSPWAPVLRGIMGASMAGVYPVGMKLAASWARRDMGLLIGLLVGALTVGSAAPHLISAVWSVDWRMAVAVSSGLAACSALLIGAFRPGEAPARPSSFRAKMVLTAWRVRPLRLANLGYFGHMWELYALWAWAGAYLQASYALRPGGTEAALGAKLLTFATVAIGGLGALGGGWLADRIGRTRLTALAMLISGSCALLAGPLFGGPPLLVAALFLLWGLTVVADSAQFSACILELAPRELQGTLVTIQTSVGFLITVGSIHLVARIQDSTGWVWAFTALAPGPLLGAVAMLRLRGHPEAKKIAGGLG